MWTNAIHRLAVQTHFVTIWTARSPACVRKDIPDSRTRIVTTWMNALTSRSCAELTLSVWTRPDRIRASVRPDLPVPRRSTVKVSVPSGYWIFSHWAWKELQFVRIINIVYVRNYWRGFDEMLWNFLATDKDYIGSRFHFDKRLWRMDVIICTDK